MAVIGYVATDAPTIMPLRRGDTLVCDASEVAIRTRLTNAAALRAFHRRGVAVFTVEGLHAKVIASPSFAWVGSANASANSRDNLIEASVRTTGPTAARVHTWASGLATMDRELSARDIRDLLEIKLDPFRPGPTVSKPPLAPPPGLSRLIVIETTPTTTKADDAAMEGDRGNAKAAARADGLPARLESIICADGTAAKPGDWVIDVRSGHVRPPAVIVRIGKHRRGDIVWVSQAKVARRPRNAELRAAHRKLTGDFGEDVIRGSAAVGRILDLFS